MKIECFVWCVDHLAIQDAGVSEMVARHGKTMYNQQILSKYD